MASTPQHLSTNFENRYMSSRIASAAIGLPLLFLIIWVGSLWFSVVVGEAAAIGALELSNLAGRWGDRPVTVLAVGSAIALVAIAHFLASSYSDGAKVPLIVPIAAAVSVVWLLWHSRPDSKSSAWLVTVAAALYTGGLLFHAPLLRAAGSGPRVGSPSHTRHICRRYVRLFRRQSRGQTPPWPRP